MFGFDSELNSSSADPLDATPDATRWLSRQTLFLRSMHRVTDASGAATCFPGQS